jgi:transposase
LRREWAKQNANVTGPPGRAGSSIVAGVTIDLQNTVESLEQLGRALALAILGEHVDDRRRCRAVPWPVIHRRNPKPASLGLASSGIQRRKRRLVGEQLRSCSVLILSQYKRALFGRRSEKMDADQLQFLLSGNEQSIVAGVANENAAADAAGNDTKAGASDNPSRPRRNRNRGMLPVHLPRVDVVIDVESKICPCCGGSLHKIGETVKEMFDVVPVQYRVKRMVRPRYGCRGCESTVVQAPAPAQPVDGGMATEAVLAHVAMMKYGYQVPLYRQEQMLAGQGIRSFSFSCNAASRWAMATLRSSASASFSAETFSMIDVVSMSFCLRSSGSDGKSSKRLMRNWLLKNTVNRQHN